MKPNKLQALTDLGSSLGLATLLVKGPWKGRPYKIRPEAIEGIKRVVYINTWYKAGTHPLLAAVPPLLHLPLSSCFISLDFCIFFLTTDLSQR